MIDENGCIVFGPKTKTCPSWPVRIVGMQGLWRYVGPVDDLLDGQWTIEVIGPYFPNTPSRNGGRSRVFYLDKIKYAGKQAKPVDVLSVESRALSQRAQRRS
jgi:hypothetical protein